MPVKSRWDTSCGPKGQVAFQVRYFTAADLADNSVGRVIDSLLRPTWSSARLDMPSIRSTCWADPSRRTGGREGASRVILDLYAGFWESLPLGPRDQVISADEKTSIQARRRQLAAPGPGQPGRMESDYQRRGALQYLCAPSRFSGADHLGCRRRTRSGAGTSTRVGSGALEQAYR